MGEWSKFGWSDEIEPIRGLVSQSPFSILPYESHRIRDIWSSGRWIFVGFSYLLRMGLAGIHESLYHGDDGLPLSSAERVVEKSRNTDS